MNNSLNLHRAFPSTTRLAVPCLLLALGCLLASPPDLLHAQFQSDDFNDGNDDGWTRYDALAPAGMNATYSFPNGGYRIQTTYLGGSPQLTGRSGSVRPEIYTSFYVAVDIVAWNDALPQSFGLLARIRTPGLGTTTGYAFTWDRGNPANATAGDLDISKITGEEPSDVPAPGSSFRLQPGHSYRMVFIGRGANLEGRVYELPDTTTPLITIQGADATYTSGMNGMVVFDNSGGRFQTDATFDNFYATDIYVLDPPRITMTKGDFGEYELSWPADASGFVLQSSTVLPGTAWTDEAFSLSDTLDRYVYTMQTDPRAGGLPQSYFRLIRR